MAMEFISKSLEDKLHLSPHFLGDDGQQALPPPHQHLLHVAMVPYPLQGHINPMMQFAKSLIANHGVKVSFINIKHHHDRIQQTRRHSAALPPSSLSLLSHASNKPITELHEENLQFFCIDDGSQADFDYTDLGPRLLDFHVTLSVSMRDPLKKVLQSLNQKSPPISCVVFGSFWPYVQEVAAELGLPSFFFWTQSASVLSMYYHAPLLQANGFFPYNAEQAVLDQCIEEHEERTNEVVSYVPGVPPLRQSSFPTLFHIDDISDRRYSTIREQFNILPSCQGVIVNSFEELEKDTYKPLQEELPCPISFVGPLIPSAFLEEGDSKDTSIGASLLEEKVECIEWLDRQKKQSVVYVSFGSLFHPSPEDLESIANGIKDSKQPFLWVIRPKSSQQNVAAILPKGFMDDTKDYGLIIPWAPQVQVLSHPSVGAFLTHCGWNSTLESVSMGVPMIPCPVKSDQPTNSAYVCEIWKIGRALQRHSDGRIRSLDVEKVLRSVLQSKDGEEMRKRSAELRRAARTATKAQGSSSTHIQQFIQSVRNYISTRQN